MSVILSKKIEFGKYDFFGCGRNRNDCDVTIELRKRGGEDVFRIINGKREYTGEKTPEYVELAICGEVWNNLHTKIVSGGQNLDEMAKVIDDPKFQKIHEIWKKWHLNGTHAGTPEQEEVIEEWLKDGLKYDYDRVCELLKECGLYEVEYTGKTVGRYYDHEPIKYGHAWIIKELPEDVIEFVKEVC